MAYARYRIGPPPIGLEHLALVPAIVVTIEKALLGIGVDRFGVGFVHDSLAPQPATHLTPLGL